MKKLYLVYSLIFAITIGYSQTNFPEKRALINANTNLPVINPNQNKTESHEELQYTNLVYDCNTTFWTVNFGGYIKQWDLIGNQVSGGSLVMSGAGESLAFCGPSSDLSFYTSYTFITPVGVKKYNNSTSSWVTIPTSLSLLNIGGYHEDIYFQEGIGTSIYYFDGTNFNLIPGSTTATHEAVADLAVDSHGRAWAFFVGDMINEVKVFDHNGLVATYPMTTPISSEGCYGSFFLNDKLYIGKTNNTIIPIIISGSTASAGPSILFYYDGFGDMASCNAIVPLHISENNLGNQIGVYPNPTKDMLNINLNEEVLSLLVYSIDGKLIKTANNTKSIDISDLAKSTYLLKVISDKNVYNKFVVKE